MKFQSLIFLFALVLIIPSCDKDDPEPVNEEEVINTFIYNLVPDDGSELISFTFNDEDGDGGEAPTIVSATLAANTLYTGSVALTANTPDGTENVTEEVEEEAEEHQFFYASTIADLEIAYDDVDADGNPIGINTTLQTGEAGSGALTITLRHEPDKNGTDVSAGNIANAGGETDIEVTFDVEVQ